MGFGHCSKLSNIVLPNCTQIGSYAFTGCTKLKSITILASTCALSAYAFEILTSIYVRPEFVDSYKTKPI